MFSGLKASETYWWKKLKRLRDSDRGEKKILYWTSGPECALFDVHSLTVGRLLFVRYISYWYSQIQAKWQRFITVQLLSLLLLCSSLSITATKKMGPVGDDTSKKDTKQRLLTEFVLCDKSSSLNQKAKAEAALPFVFAAENNSEWVLGMQRYSVKYWAGTIHPYGPTVFGFAINFALMLHRPLCVPVQARRKSLPRWTRVNVQSLLCLHPRTHCQSHRCNWRRVQSAARTRKRKKENKEAWPLKWPARWWSVGRLVGAGLWSGRLG